jgi:hypothetical protein
MKCQPYSRHDLERLLSSLAETSGALTIYVEPSLFPDFVLNLKLEPCWEGLVNEVKVVITDDTVLRAAQRYGTGAAIFWSEGAGRYLILPPFTLTESRAFTGVPDVSTLQAMLAKRFVLGVVLVAWGSYALGVFDGGRLVEWKTGTGYIHKKHRKGGRSEKRFARRTEEQKKDFLRRVANRIDERFSSASLDHIFFGGNRLILKPLVRECHYLQTNANKLSSRLLETRYADRETLLRSYREITTSLVFSF